MNYDSNIENSRKSSKKNALFKNGYAKIVMQNDPPFMSKEITRIQTKLTSYIDI